MKNTIKKQIFSYSIFYEAADEGGYVAIAPSLPGCHTQGDTLEEAEKNIKEAIEVYLESLTDENEPIPLERKSYYSTIEIPAMILA